MKKKIIAILLVIALALSSVAILVGCDKLDLDTQVQTFNVQGDLKVGIISDSQLPPKAKKDDGKYKNNLTIALRGLKANGVNMIIFAGDIGDEASIYAYDTFYSCFSEVYGINFKLNASLSDTFNVDKPLVQTIMGNHDYWGRNDGILSKNSYRKMFEKKIGHSPFTHYVVNGYHFIGASPEQGSPMDDQHPHMTEWIDGEIAKAVADDATKPVFVTTHNSAANTVYGSEDWGDKKLYNVFAKYPQVVNISGHLHYSILDERSMWQGDFTAFSTQSVSYTELEGGKVNGSIPPNAWITPMGEIMEFESSKVVIKRMNFGIKDSVTGAFGVEEKSSMRWELPIPLTKDKFTYTNEIKQANNLAPTMTADSGTFKVEGDNTFVTFVAGSDDDFVHSYKLVWTGGGKTIETLYFTDFINGIAGMSKQVTLQVYDIPKGVYNLQIYAVDSYGKTSINFTTINNVEVKAKVKY